MKAKLKSIFFYYNLDLSFPLITKLTQYIDVPTPIQKKAETKS